MSIALVASACSLMTSLDGLTGGSSSEDGGSGASRGSISTSSGSGSGGAPSSGSSSSSSGGASADDAGGEKQETDAGHGGSGTNDASSPGDAGTDAGHASSVDAASPFCASQSPAPLFCDDFDEGSGQSYLAAPWDQLATTSGAATLTTSSFVSSPSSMLVAVEPNASVTSIDVAGYKSFTAKQGVAGTATMAFDIQIVAGDESSASDAILGAIQLWNGSAYWDLELEVFWDASNGYFDVDLSEDGNGSGSSYVPHPTGGHISLNQWTHVTLAITLPGSGGATTATMNLDSASGSNTASDTVHVTTSDPIPEILVGTTYATPAGAGWTVLYDNVTFDE